jgi:hypothetical protein
LIELVEAEWGSQGKAKTQANKNFVPDRRTLAFCEGVFKSRLVKPVKLRVIQVVFAGEVVFVLQTQFQLRDFAGGG